MLRKQSYAAQFYHSRSLGHLPPSEVDLTGGAFVASSLGTGHQHTSTMINRKHSPNPECSSRWKEERHGVEELPGQRGSGGERLCLDRDVCKAAEHVACWEQALTVGGVEATEEG